MKLEAQRTSGPLDIPACATKSFALTNSLLVNGCLTGYSVDSLSNTLNCIHLHQTVP